MYAGNKEMKVNGNKDKIKKIKKNKNQICQKMEYNCRQHSILHFIYQIFTKYLNLIIALKSRVFCNVIIIL